MFSRKFILEYTLKYFVKNYINISFKLKLYILYYIF